MVGSRGAVALHRPNGTDTPTRRWRGPAHRHQQIDGHVDNDVVFGGRITEPAVPLQTYPSELVLLVVLCGLGPFRHSVYSSARRFAAVPRCITVQPHLNLSSIRPVGATCRPRRHSLLQPQCQSIWPWLGVYWQPTPSKQSIRRYRRGTLVCGGEDS